MAGRGPLQPTGSLNRRAGLLAASAGLGTRCPAAGLGCCRGRWCTFRRVRLMLRATSELRTGSKSAIYHCLVSSAQHHALLAVSPHVSVSVNNKLVLYCNSSTGSTGFSHACFPQLIPHRVFRKFGYLPLELFPKLGVGIAGRVGG